MRRPNFRLSLGFTLVGVVIGIAILTILIAAVGPSIAAIMQRDRENELIFRGKQYARAIVAFQRRYGRLPMELKEMYANRPRTIRQLWKEPMCDCDDWQAIVAGSPDAAPMGPGGAPGAGGAPGGSRRTPASGNQPPSTYTGLFPPTTPPPSSSGRPPGPVPTSIFNAGETRTIGPIVGVRSKVHKRGYRTWRERDYYDEWRFIAGDADNDLAQAFDPFSLGPRRTPSPRR